ncbi:hypothetical protein ABH925_007582, partial [Streptacidiphilus sp. EB129]
TVAARPTTTIQQLTAYQQEDKVSDLTAFELHPNDFTSTVIDLTVAEVRKLMAACAPRATHPRTRSHALNWSNWRRRRQAVARRCHYRRRCHTIEGRPTGSRP